MMVRFLCIVLIVFQVTIGKSQHVRCGTSEYMSRNFNENKTWKQQLELFENQLTDATATDTVVIPVVVHVVYNTSSQNITDQQILSQIDVLNEDFNAYNSDTYLIPSTFKNSAGQSLIFFCLTQVDPSGNATTGITRTQTSVGSFYYSDSIKFDSLGGKSAWDASRFLNIWVGNLSNNLLGYATLPGGPEVIDGVVIRYTAFGRTGTLIPPYNKGRTATHEVGHWFNLKHIWGDSYCGNDNVSDTPKQEKANFGCPSYPHVTCNNGPNGDMFMNYMDYTDDNCMHLFTAGQCTRMLAAINQFRPQLLNTTACSFVLPPPDSTTYTEPVTIFYDQQQASYYISWQSDVEKTDLILFNVAGQQLLQQSFESKKNGDVYEISLDLYSNGVYVAGITVNGNYTTFKMEKKD